MAITSPRANQTNYPIAPIDWGNGTIGRLEEWVRKVVEVVNRILNGKINATGDVTLAASSATTTLSDMRITPNSFIGFMPTTANAAAEIGAGTLYVSARTEEQATLTHANNAQTDRTYRYVVLG